MKRIHPALVLTLAIVPGVIAARAAEAQSVVDKQFVAEAISGDIGEVEIGQLAQVRGATPGVRDFGRMLQSDHAQARTQMTSVATGLGVTPPTRAKKEVREEYKKLSGLQGSAFDAEFLRAMVEDHQKDIQDFQMEAKSGSGPAPKMAAQQLPILQKHLMTAQSLENEATTP